jgi:hypothetical protein
MTRRPVSFDKACREFVHRFTMEHVPAWAKEPNPLGGFYAPHFRTDREWYDNTLFKGETELASPRHCYTTGHTWPMGQRLTAPYVKGQS